MGVVGLELGVEVAVAVGGVVEAVETHAGVLVGAVGHDREGVVGGQAPEVDAAVLGVEGVEGDRLAVEGELPDGGRVEVDERVGPRIGALEAHGGGAGERVAVARQVEGHVVGEHRQAGGPGLGLGSGEVVVLHAASLHQPGLLRRRYAPFVRIALVCPYSLTVPGGVQGQVLGLARALRTLGHDARVLGPCDGPPPEVGVIPLGNSIPTAANGSMAPIAPDPSCAMRTMAVLRDEHFDVLHLHEPLAPGPTVTCVALASGPWWARSTPPG